MSSESVQEANRIQSKTSKSKKMEDSQKPEEQPDARLPASQKLDDQLEASQKPEEQPDAQLPDVQQPDVQKPDAQLPDVQQPDPTPCEKLMCSKGKVKRFFKKYDIECRLSNDVYATIDTKLKRLIEKEVGTMSLEKGSVKYDRGVDDKDSLIFPRTIVEKFVRDVIKEHLGISRVAPHSIPSRVQGAVEDELKAMCKCAQQKMLTSKRKTLFASDVEHASKSGQL